MTPQAPRPLDKVNREFHASGPIALWVVDYVRSHLGELRLCCLDRRSSSPDRGLEGLLFNGSRLRPVGPGAAIPRPQALLRTASTRPRSSGGKDFCDRNGYFGLGRLYNNHRLFGIIG